MHCLAFILLANEANDEKATFDDLVANTPRPILASSLKMLPNPQQRSNDGNDSDELRKMIPEFMAPVCPPDVKQSIDKTNSILGLGVLSLPIKDRAFSRCKEILKHVLQQSNVFWFKDPVDEVSSGAVGYYTIIKHPMDLSTLRKLYLDGSLTKPSATLLDFVNDGRVIWQNSFRFNDPTTEPFQCAQKLATYWEHQVRQAFRSLRSDQHSTRSVAFDLPLSRSEFETLAQHLLKLNPESQNKFFEMVRGTSSTTQEAKEESKEEEEGTDCDDQAVKRPSSEEIDLALIPPTKMREIASFVEKEFKAQNSTQN